MRIDKPADITRWTTPDGPEVQPEPGYDEWLEAEIAEGIAQLDAGKVVTLDQLKAEFGLE